jgi:hypothetical protein
MYRVVVTVYEQTRTILARVRRCAMVQVTVVLYTGG